MFDIILRKDVKIVTALKMRAFGAFDNIDVQVIIGTEDKVKNICDVLNNFCKAQPECNHGLRLVDCMERDDNVIKLMNTMVKNCDVSKEQANAILDRVRNCCFENYVYVYTNMFSVVNI
jgi:hypothetical protein